jgi:hypothetical protein
MSLTYAVSITTAVFWWEYLELLWFIKCVKRAHVKDKVMSFGLL